MVNFPGRSVDEIMALAKDIRINVGGGCNHSEVVEFSMLPAAEEALEAYGDQDVGGYSYSTVIHCGRRIARQLDSLGYVDIT